MKILRKVKAWLDAEDIPGDLGANILISAVRYGILISLIVGTIILLLK